MAQERTGWTAGVGAAPMVAPAFLGSNDYRLRVFPDLRVNYKDDFFASVPDGVGYNLVNTEGWKAGPLAKIRFSRKEDDGGSPFVVGRGSNDLRGLGDVGTAGEVGGFMQYEWRRMLRTRLEVRQGFGGHHGVVGEGKLDYLSQLGPVRTSFGPRASFGSADYTNTYFGISPTQSLNSGLAQYKAGGGLVSYGFGGSATWPVSRSLAVTAFGGYDRLTGDVANSPLIEERGTPNQATLGVALGYQFGLSDL